MITATAAGALGGLLALGVWERVLRDRAHAAVATRIHVNGTRGKSTVTRLIAAGLRASGRRTLGKTTGTAARLLLPDGTDLPIRRRAPASIREQLWVLREARRRGAEALVVECMAIDPALQAVSERHMMAATIGVITNARLDHGDLMGESRASVIDALSATVPAGGTLVLGPDLAAGPFADTVRRRQARVVRADPSTVMSLVVADTPTWVIENVATALATTRLLGIDDTLAVTAMQSAAPDPGAVTVRDLSVHGRRVAIIDASAANDPESLALLLTGQPRACCLYVFNHRADRPLRLRQFAAAPSWARAGAGVMVTGDAPDWATRAAVGRAGLPASAFTSPRHLAARLRDRLRSSSAITAVIVCGNTRGLDVDDVADALGDRPDAPASLAGRQP